MLCEIFFNFFATIEKDRRGYQRSWVEDLLVVLFFFGFGVRG